MITLNQHIKNFWARKPLSLDILLRFTKSHASKCFKTTLIQCFNAAPLLRAIVNKKCVQYNFFHVSMFEFFDFQDQQLICCKILVTFMIRLDLSKSFALLAFYEIFGGGVVTHLK